LYILQTSNGNGLEIQYEAGPGHLLSIRNDLQYLLRTIFTGKSHGQTWLKQLIFKYNESFQLSSQHFKTSVAAIGSLISRITCDFVGSGNTLIQPDFNPAHLVQKSSLNKGSKRKLLRSSLGKSLSQLPFRCKQVGVELLSANEAFCTQGCVRCHHNSPQITPADKVITCRNCGECGIRDNYSCLKLLLASIDCELPCFYQLPDYIEEDFNAPTSFDFNIYDFLQNWPTQRSNIDMEMDSEMAEEQQQQPFPNSKHLTKEERRDLYLEGNPIWSRTEWINSDRIGYFDFSTNLLIPQVTGKPRSQQRPVVLQKITRERRANQGKNSKYGDFQTSHQ
jgi:hypothetical protein